MGRPAAMYEEKYLAGQVPSLGKRPDQMTVID
jgi:hypothetical protein